MIVLAAYYYGKPGTGDAIVAHLERMSGLVKETEPDCYMYHACRSVDNPDNFMLYEHYTNQDALDFHRSTPHFKEIIEGIIVPMLETRERFFYDLAVS